MTRAGDPVSEMVVEMLAASEAELRARLRDVERERDAYRELLQLAVNALHGALAESDRQFEIIVLQRDAIRELRGGAGAPAHRTAA